MLPARTVLQICVGMAQEYVGVRTTHLIGHAYFQIQHQRSRECTLTTNLTYPVPVLRGTHCRGKSIQHRKCLSHQLATLYPDSGIRSTVASVPWSYSQASAPIAHLFGTSSYAAHSRGAVTLSKNLVFSGAHPTLVEVLCKQRET